MIVWLLLALALWGAVFGDQQARLVSFVALAVLVPALLLFYCAARFGSGLPPRPSPKPVESPSRVLIVEDDVDFAVVLHRIFQGLGCETEWIKGTSLSELRKLSSAPYDLILLDWRLGKRTAADLIRTAQRLARRMGFRWSLRRAKVITMSAAEAPEIYLPKLRTRFRHLGHWDKRADYDSLRDKAITALVS